jgi:redox-sensitive bicupin YhaK (pirin superfamily)
VKHAFAPGHGGYLYVIEGSLRLNDEKLGTGDAAKIASEPHITLEADGPTELILVDVTL